MKTPHIAFVGDITVDRYVKQNETHLGGSSVTGAIWAKRLGAQSAIIAAVGSDGVKLPRRIDTSHIRILPGKTSSIEIRTVDGERHYGKWDPGVLAHYHFSKEDIAFMNRNDAAVLTVYPKTKHLLKEFRLSSQTLRVVDFGNELMPVDVSHLDSMVFGLNFDTDQEKIKKIKELAKKYNKLAIVTLGKGGSIACEGEKMWAVPGKQVKAIDTTGAGDSFLAAFLITYLPSHDIRKSLEKGTELASKVIQNIGAY